MLTNTFNWEAYVYIVYIYVRKLNLKRGPFYFYSNKHMVNIANVNNMHMYVAV